MPFSINSSEPPDGAKPTGDGYLFKLPESQGLNGMGEPVGGIGYPEVEIRFERLSETGWEWYVNYTGTDLSANVTNLQVWNPFKTGGVGWETFSTAVMHRPEYENVSQGSYIGVVVRFTRLVS